MAHDRRIPELSRVMPHRSKGFPVIQPVGLHMAGNGFTQRIIIELATIFDKYAHSPDDPAPFRLETRTQAGQEVLAYISSGLRLGLDLRSTDRSNMSSARVISWSEAAVRFLGVQRLQLLCSDRALGRWHFPPVLR